MYTVYLNGNQLMYTPIIAGDDERYVLIDPELSLELNTAGTFTCTVPKSNIRYDDLQVLKSTITIFNGTLTDDETLWRGRIISIERDMYGNRKITAEGDLALFSDYYEPSFERYGAAAEKVDYVWTGTCERFWELLIGHYNGNIPESSADTDKYINEYVIDDELKGIRFQLENRSFTTSFDMIKNELLEKVGGYVWIEWQDYGYKRILHHSIDSGEKINQCIRFGENMLDINECIDGTAVYTGIIAEGPNDENGMAYTLLNYGVPAADAESFGIRNYCLYYKPAVELFGMVQHYEKFDAATNYTDMYNRAKERLLAALAESMSVSVSAADLSYIDDNNERFKLGCKIRCISANHGLDEYFRMRAMTIPLGDPSAETYTLGLAVQTMTAQSNVSASKVKKVEKSAVTVKSRDKKKSTSSSTTAGCINLGDEVILAYGYVSAKSVGQQADFSISYSDAGFKNSPFIVTVPTCGDKGSGGATISTHLRSVSQTGATVSVLKTSGTNSVGVMWIAIGY